jgi:pimeloyl-ACP methyl ester carboxylesterase
MTPSVNLRRRPVVLLHGYSDNGQAFDPWRRALMAAGWTADQLVTVSYESLTNEVSVRDIAEGFDKLLRQRVGLADDEPFDVMVHSTGMLVLRAWLTRRGATGRRLARVKHVIALAPATFGSPLAHKGRSFLGALLKGRKAIGPDFLEAGDQVLDALELGGRFSWELAHTDLFGEHPFYDTSRSTPYMFVFCGNRGYRGLSALVNSPGTDGTVRWAGCALNCRKLVMDLTADCPDTQRVHAADWTQDDVPLHPINGVDHTTILSKPPAELVELVVQALAVNSRPMYAQWCDAAHRVVQQTRDALEPWQQFVIRAIDERGDSIPDWNLQLMLASDDRNASLTPFAQDVHVYKHDPSYRCFHVNLSKLADPSLVTGRARRLKAQLFASTGTARVLYTGALVDPMHVAPPGKAGTWFGTIDLSSVLPGGAVRFFHPFTTTFVELRLDREPLTGNGMVVRLDPS